MKEYLDLLQHTLDHGRYKMDRTGTGCYSVFGYQMRFDLAKGFPVVTTKKLHLRSIIHELLWFLKGDTNIGYLKSLGVRIWDEWASASGDLGPIYGFGWRYAPVENPKHLVQVAIRSDQDADYVEQIPAFQPPIKCDLNNERMWAIEDLGADGGNTRYKVQFASGFITEITRPNWRALTDYDAVDGYARTVRGVGYLGNPVLKHDRLYALWRNMLARCYDPAHPSYPSYGGAGITVSPIWHSYEQFVRTTTRLPLYALWNIHPGNYDLDKDYYGSGVYSPSTCVFIPQELNTALPKDGIALAVKGQLFANWEAFARHNRIRPDYIKARISEGHKCGEFHPDDFEEVRPKEGYLYRQKFYVDQIADAIHTLRTSPASRRIIVNAWLPSLIADQALTPCHAMFQFYAEELTLQERATLYIAKQYPEGISAAQYNADHLLGLVKIYEEESKLTFHGEYGAAGQPELEQRLEMIEVILEEHKIPKHRLSCQLMQRSGDEFLGVPFNIASYALLTEMVAQVCDMAPGDFIHTLGDAHIYSNHLEQVKLQLTREPLPLPKLLLNPAIKNIDDFTFDDIRVVGYESHPAIKGDVAV